jgi:hypothetical protein
MATLHVLLGSGGDMPGHCGHFVRVASCHFGDAGHVVVLDEPLSQGQLFQTLCFPAQDSHQSAAAKAAIGQWHGDGDGDGAVQQTLMMPPTHRMSSAVARARHMTLPSLPW